MVARLASWVLAAAVVAAAVGCGTSGDRERVRTAAQRLATAMARDDGRTACAQLSPALRTQLSSYESEPCPQAVLKLALRGTRVASVGVYATSARARLAGGDTLFLGDTRLGWRVEALGCRPRNAGPYDCQAES